MNMEVRRVACGIFQLELERVLEEIKEEWASVDEFKVTYVASALHVDLEVYMVRHDFQLY